MSATGKRRAHANYLGAGVGGGQKNRKSKEPLDQETQPQLLRPRAQSSISGIELEK